METEQKYSHRTRRDEEWVQIEERLELVMERIAGIARHDEEELTGAFRDYFTRTAEFILRTHIVLEAVRDRELENWSLREHEEMNRELYRDISPEEYDASYGNPACAVERLGEEYGGMLSMLYAELRALIACAYEGDGLSYTILCELFVQVYTCLCDPGGSSPREVKDIIYWFFHDYSELFTERSVLGMIDPQEDFYTGLVMESNLDDVWYLYRYGLPIGENELGLFRHFAGMSEEQIQRMADTYTEGYRIGFVTTGKDLSIKRTVNIEYAVGMERMVRQAIRNFEKMGLKPTVYREAESSFRGRGGGKRGCYSVAGNRQYDYDHRQDKALYLDKAFVERRLETLRDTYEKHKELAGGYGGPAVIEVFGEPAFAPVNKQAALHYSGKQNELNVYYASAAGEITNRYIRGEERSFTIIAYPLPQIGPRFPEIFDKTVEINTLDYTRYRDMQAAMIAVLDRGVKAHVKGKGANQTDLTVALYPLRDPEKETIFENCVADVNIPVGEVFTSPVLKGTNGLLHVSSVYLNGLHYKELKMTFADGMVTDYSCQNFDSAEENRKYIYDNVLMQHDTLPMGEFAIGTNTRAYRMARDYGIADKLPILIAEKTGPHFAVGDTCYSHAEDTRVYNPDGKEIVARDNEVSILRREDSSKAYLNCHTDITIPYDELDHISVEAADGSISYIIREGRFVVPGTEELNEPLDENRR